MSIKLVSFLVNLTNARIGDIESVMSPIDGPVHKDFTGFPTIRGHYIKGANKSLFCRKDNADVERILYGDKNFSGLIIFGQHNLLAIPIPSSEFGLLYVTCPKALNELLLCLNNTRYNKFRAYIKSLVSNILCMGDNQAIVFPKIDKQHIELFGGEIILKAIQSEAIKPLYQLIQSIVPFTSHIGFRISIVSDTLMQLIIKRALITKPGIKLKGMKDDIYEKVVEHGPWFEEEIPKFSIFAGYLLLRKEKIDRKYINHIMKTIEQVKDSLSIKVSEDKIELSLNTLKKIVRETSPIIMSSRETIGRGLFRIELLEVVDKNYLIAGRDKYIKIFDESELESAEKLINSSTEKIRKEKMDIQISPSYIKESLELFAGIKDKVEDVHGKISSFPERLCRLGIINIHYYYSEIKKDSTGEGYPEMNKLVNVLIKKEDLEPSEKIDYLSRLLSYYLSVETKSMILKRLVQSYKKSGD